MNQRDKYIFEIERKLKRRRYGNMCKAVLAYLVLVIAILFVCSCKVDYTASNTSDLGCCSIMVYPDQKSVIYSTNDGHTRTLFYEDDESRGETINYFMEYCYHNHY